MRYPRCAEWTKAGAPGYGELDGAEPVATKVERLRHCSSVSMRNRSSVFEPIGVGGYQFVDLETDGRGIRVFILQMQELPIQ